MYNAQSHPSTYQARYGGAGIRPGYNTRYPLDQRQAIANLRIGQRTHGGAGYPNGNTHRGVTGEPAARSITDELPTRIAKHFPVAEKTQKVKWYPTPPIELNPGSQRPVHSVAYLEWKRRRKERLDNNREATSMDVETVGA
ncbi:hypothetical protein BZG36_03852 [Bifiguratus adelaidae]|uniref:Uncharacterized protein n=1 Tax=Bifiguratus adelaidae TaxID=1938954 RepID=A0A261XWH2_9FUNG|nr:hypothetical protein BZG36_03852 [Bifiguratus adelaidae]